MGLGLAAGLLSGITFGTSGSFATSLIRSGWTPGAAVLARIALAALVLSVPALVQARRRGVSARSVRAIAVYGVVAVAAAQLCYFNAVAHLSVAVALLLEYSGILLVVLWGWMRRGRRPGVLTILAVAAALGGLVLVLDLAGARRLDAVGVLWAVGAALGLATYFIIAAESSEMVSPLLMTWGGLAIGAVVLGAVGAAGILPLHAVSADVVLLDRHVSWVVPVLGLAIVAAAVAYLAGIVAARILGARLASFVGLVEVLSAVACAWLLLGQHLDGTQAAGGVLVVAGIALMRIDEMRRPSGSREEQPLPGVDEPALELSR